MQDVIRESTFVGAPIDRVWRAISDYREFGTWFRVNIDRPFAAGAQSTGMMTVPGYEHVPWNVDVVAIEPPHRLAFHWHPYAIDPDKDYSHEPRTLVEFLLSERDGGTEITVTETGFSAIPEGRRDEAFRMNSQGWAAQVKNVAQYVAG